MPQKEILLAGAARRIITPLRGIFLIGYGDRSKGNLGVHDDLTATALVLDDGALRIAIVALDMLAINEFIVDRVRQQLAPTEVLLCCSHTHSGPIAYADKRSPRNNQAYINALVDSIVSAVLEASANFVPAHLAYSCGEADVAINRRERKPDGHFEIGRNPAGPVDRSVQVVSVFALTPTALTPSPSPNSGRGGLSTSGSPLPNTGEGSGVRVATLVNFACHGTVLGPDNLLASADWIGVMRNEAEKELGGFVLFLQGATANLNPDMDWDSGRSFTMMEAQGRKVAKSEIATTINGSRKMHGNLLAITRREAWMPTEIPAATSRPPKDYAKPLLAMAKMPAFMAIFADPLLNKRYPWKPRIEARDGYWSVPMRIDAVRIGELALVAFAAETFTEIGMKVKANSPASQTLFASVTDGCISYLHTADSHPEGGYEVDVAPLAYRYPGRLQARCEQVALETTGQMLSELWK